MIGTGVTNMVGVGMIGATAGMVNQMPAGMGKDIAGVVPGLQSVALLGPNIKLAKTSLGGLGNGKRKGKKKNWY
jgi:hypothetical protein